MNTLPCTFAALLIAASASSFASETKPVVDPAVQPSGDQRSRQDAPGEAIPGTTVRPEGMDQSNVPKTTMDRKNAQAQDVGASNTDMNKPQLAERDRNFLINANQVDMAEMSAGEMAKMRAKNPEVKAYGTMMMADHQKSHGVVMTLANSNGVPLEKKLDAEHQAMADKLKAASTDSFDKMFMDEMVVGHQKAIAAHEMTSKESKDAKVKALADNNLPTLRTHLMEAQRVQGMLSKKTASR